MVSGQQLKFKQASAKVRAEGIKPFTKAFGSRMKQLLSKGHRSVKKRVTKHKKSKQKRKVKAKSNPRTKKSLAGKKGTSGTTRLKKFLIGLGIGTGVSTVVGLTKVREIEFVGPLADAAVGGGVEGQLGVVLPKLVRTLLLRSGGFSFNGGNGPMANEGA